MTTQIGPLLSKKKLILLAIQILFTIFTTIVGSLLDIFLSSPLSLTISKNVSEAFDHHG